MERVEIAIIGTGPGGVSAALTAKARNKKILLFGKKDMSAKVKSAHQVNNYPGLPGITGEDFAKAFEQHLEFMEIPVEERQVTAVYAMGDYFAIQTDGDMYEAETVILAAGVAQSKLLEGENELVGRALSYCATCDAQFYKGKKVAVLGYNEESASEAEFLAEVASEVVYFPQQGAGIPNGDNIEIIKEKPIAIRGAMKAEAIETEKGTYPADGIFILRDAVAPDRLIPGIEVEGSHVKVNLQMETNLPGCFACGDVTGRPYQYIKSAGQGNVAALSAVSYLAEKRKKQK